MKHGTLVLAVSCVLLGACLARPAASVGVAVAPDEGLRAMGACYEYGSTGQSYCYNSGQCGGCGCSYHQQMIDGPNQGIAAPCAGDQTCTSVFTITNTVDCS